MATPEAFGHYLAAWNEPDPDEIRGHLERSCAEDVRFIDPANQVQGIDAIAAMIREAHDAMKAEYVRVSGIDGHNQRYRVLWEVRRPGEAPFPGMDMTTLNDAGLMEVINGFFGNFPPYE